MSVLDFIKPPPTIEEIQDQSLVKKNYRYWRLRTFYAMYVGYAFYYFTRKSFTYAIPAMQIELGLSKYEIGLIGSILSLAYGASKFLSGIIGDRSNPRYFMSIGLILTGIFNLCFGLSATWWAFAIFWGLNGIFQGWGWPGCARLLTHWYSQSERGRWWGIWNTAHNLGGAVIPVVMAYATHYFGWRTAMYIPALLAIVVGFFIMDRLRDTPQSLGLPSIEKFRGEEASGQALRDSEKTLSTKEILWTYVLSNRYIWIMAMAYFFIYVIRTAVNDWSMVYLIEEKHYSIPVAGACVFWFEIGGFFGSLMAGWSSDVWFKGKRNPVNVIYTLGIILVLFAFKTFATPWPVFDSLFLFLFGFFIFGPQMLIGMVTAELSHKKAAATATGFAGCFAYLGAACAGGPLGAVMKMWGWESYFLTLLGCSVLSILVMIPMWSIKTNPRYAIPEGGEKAVS
ncbi:MAG: hypothetical protein RL235_921 [Chlamydiota bacterium]|jgi:OPA family sugar phosphate sensor protein UhpC-like MFS transporter